ncbi:MAG: carboxypeptidase-like regulatory domain-containing protein [Methanotrichaceae archaeon]|jgi:hypothetical protein
MEPEGIVDFQSANSINDIHDPYFRIKKIELIDGNERLSLRLLGVCFFFLGYFLGFLYPVLIENPRIGWSSLFIYFAITFIYIYFFTKISINKMITLGIVIIFLISSILIFISTNAIVFGKLIDSNGKPISQIEVQIGNLTTVSGIFGEYEIDNVPRDSHSIKFLFPGYEKIQKFNISMFSIWPKENQSFLGKKINMNITGTINDEKDYGLISQKINLRNPKQYNITISNPDYFNLTSTQTASDGTYNLPSIILSIEHPITIFVTKTHGGPKILYQKDLAFSDEEIDHGIKTINIMINQTWDVSGKIMEYCDQRNELPFPVKGAVVEMGSRINMTDENDKYLITRVPMETSTYNVTLVSGYKLKGNIIPSLNDDFDSPKIRNIWLCMK